MKRVCSDQHQTEGIVIFCTSQLACLSLDASGCLGKCQLAGGVVKSRERSFSYLEHQNEKDAGDGGNSDKPPPANGWVHH